MVFENQKLFSLDEDADRKVVISMSRRTDMRWFADKFIPILQQKYPPEKVHTIVVWTKFPKAIVTSPYKEVLFRYDQIYCHITITGLGGTLIEPNVPPWQETLEILPELIRFVGLSERVRVRPDPIIYLRYNGKLFSNVDLAKKIIQNASRMGIKTFSTSFVNIYPKVGERLRKNGFVPLEYQASEKRQIIIDLQKAAGESGATLYTCATPGFPSSKCIDGELLARLHPKNEPCRTDKAAGQRTLCGCTHSIDIGWYDMLCKSGCLYCYANPDRP